MSTFGGQNGAKLYLEVADKGIMEGILKKKANGTKLNRVTFKRGLH